eukprot:2449075-Lingulodinium_polyedra.AAC.1
MSRKLEPGRVGRNFHHGEEEQMPGAASRARCVRAARAICHSRSPEAGARARRKKLSSRR